MPASSHVHLDVVEGDRSITVRFTDYKVLNDDKLELMAQSISKIADRLAGRELRLDFASVEYMQSSVLGKLVALNKKVTSAGSRLVLCNINDDVFKAFAVTSLDRMFVIERAESAREGRAG